MFENFPIIHMLVPWEYESNDKTFDIRVLCDGDPWDDGHSKVKYGDMDANCQECIDIYSILKMDWNAGNK